MCAEILALKIRNCQNIKGISISGEEYKISQFADDTSLLLDGSDESLNSALNVLNQFAILSGLRVNFEKTHVIWIGSLKYSTRSIKTKWKLNWGSTCFKLLGIWFHIDQEKMIDINFKEKLEKIKKSILYWQKRQLTPIGRITVVKSLLLPFLTHLFISIPNPDKQFMQNINKLFFELCGKDLQKLKLLYLLKMCQMAD